MSNMYQVNFRIPEEIVQELNRYVDGLKIKSIPHLINVIVNEWLLYHAQFWDEEEERRKEFFENQTRKPSRKRRIGIPPRRKG